MENRSEQSYKIYFYNQPHFLLLDSQSILDINIKEKSQNVRKIEIFFEDIFFEKNLSKKSLKEWNITVQIFDNNNKFTTQLDLYGENLRSGKTKLGKNIKFDFEQISTNSAWPSLPKSFHDAEVSYMSSRHAYLRHLKIKSLID